MNAIAKKVVAKNPTAKDLTAKNPKSGTKLNADAVSIKDWKKVTKGHTAHYVYDHLNKIVPESGFLPLNYFAVWGILMGYTRECGELDFAISHKRLQLKTRLSESGLRGILKVLEARGFLHIVDKQVSHFGKKYRLRPCIPETLVAPLKASLARSGKKATYTNSTPKNRILSGRRRASTTAVYQTTRSSKKTKAYDYDDEGAPPPALEKMATAPKKLMLEEIAQDEVGEKYLSWEGKSLSKEQAFLPVPNAPSVPYQPREERAKDWLPSLSDLEATISPEAAVPATEEAKRLQIDVADWSREAQTDFFKQCYESSCPKNADSRQEKNAHDEKNQHKNSHPKKSYCQFLLQERKKLDREFPAYLAKILPIQAEHWVPTLLERMKAFQSPFASDWFPKTAEHLAAALKQYALTKDKIPVQRLSPVVALTLPTHWFNRLLKTARNFKLPQRQVLELAYHIKNASPRKPCASIVEKWEYNLCVAISLLKKGLWTCPKGLESLRTRYLEIGEKS